jgi:F-type H+-transporting ATPase subunit a
MSDPVLHIKDSYYFEFPKALLPSKLTDKAQFPGVWVKNDDQFQTWEAERLCHELEHAKLPGMPDEHTLLHDWNHWQHAGANHENFARPLDVYLEMQAAQVEAGYQSLVKQAKLAKKSPPGFEDYLSGLKGHAADSAWIARFLHNPANAKSWKQMKEKAGGKEALAAFKKDESIKWSDSKLAHYNAHLSGKVVLDPQPFGELRNLYEKESGFCISKFMILEVVIGVLLFVVFSWVAGRLKSSTAPKGRLLNLLEVFLLFIRDQIARPAIGGGHHEEHGDHGHGEHGHGDAVHSHDAHHAHDSHGHTHKAHAVHVNEGDRFVPLLWTIFFFVLLCNLFGAIPWLGAPTGSFATTFALAMVTFVTVVVSGMIKFGVAGFFLNQIPTMDLPLPLAILLKPMIFAIEILGLLIKHLVLSIRLLANMVAGHLVILGIMGLAFGAQAAANFSAPDVPAWQWWLTATIAVVGSTLFNVLELFVAFLQAYIFTFLSALFIGAAVHKH